LIDAGVAKIVPVFDGFAQSRLIEDSSHGSKSRASDLFKPRLVIREKYYTPATLGITMMIFSN